MILIYVLWSIPTEITLAFLFISHHSYCRALLKSFKTTYLIFMYIFLLSNWLLAEWFLLLLLQKRKQKSLYLGGCGGRASWGSRKELCKCRAVGRTLNHDPLTCQCIKAISALCDAAHAVILLHTYVICHDRFSNAFFSSVSGKRTK